MRSNAGGEMIGNYSANPNGTLAAALASMVAFASCLLTVPPSLAGESSTPAPDGYGTGAIGPIELSNGKTYMVVRGGSKPPCGAVIRIKPLPQEAVYLFNDVSGCGPTDAAAVEGGARMMVTTSSGGENDAGSLIWVDPSGPSDRSSLPSGSLIAGSSVLAGPPPRAPTTTIAATIYTTSDTGGANGTGAIYQSTLSTAGQLSTPELIFSFDTATANGQTPFPQAVVGPDGNLYGPTFLGGNPSTPVCMPGGCGVVYRLKPVVNGGTTTWTEEVLYTFNGGKDGGMPHGTLSFDKSGNVYGTSEFGGNFNSPSSKNCQGFNPNVNFACGVVFKLTKQASVPWKETTLYAFKGGKDGALPWGDVAFDGVGNIYGTTVSGGRITAAACTGNAVRNMTPGCGTMFKLTAQATAPWPETVLYAFRGSSDGALPSGDVTVNSTGTRIRGATLAGGILTGGCASSDNNIGWAAGCGVVLTVKP